MSTNPKTKKSAAARERRVFPGKVKCEAVLAVWAERRKPSEVCRELGIPWQQLNAWQRVALESMMAGLQPREDQEPKPALSPRLQRLLAKSERRANRTDRLEKRLKTVQKSAPKTPTGS